MIYAGAAVGFPNRPARYSASGGGPDGITLTAKESEHSTKVGLADLRAELTKYLDESAEKRPFPKPDRPMAMKSLKVIAFVQDDETGAILQAAMADLGGEHAAK